MKMIKAMYELEVIDTINYVFSQNKIDLLNQNQENLYILGLIKPYYKRKTQKYIEKGYLSYDKTQDIISEAISRFTSKIKIVELLEKYNKEKPT